MKDVDMFLGLSAAGMLTQDMVKEMAVNPIIFALANPNPEILPEDAKAVRPDAIIATGRSDYPNQVNNALCFPYIFRGALDVGATTVNEEMKIACVRAIAAMAHVEATPVAGQKSIDESKRFGREYLIPGPLEPNLILEIAPAVAKAAMDSGVATLPINDMKAYRDKLSAFVYNSTLIMKPLFAKAQQDPKRIVFCEGEDENVLRAVQVVVDEGLAKPILVGRPNVVETQIARLGLRIHKGEHYELIAPEENPHYEDFWQYHYKKNQRDGVTIELARRDVRRKTSLIGSLMVELGHADGMICGTFGSYPLHLNYVRRIIDLRRDVSAYYALNALLLQGRNLFIADTYINEDPTAEQLAEMTVLAAKEVRRFGIEPKVALLSHSNFGSSNFESAKKMRKVHDLLTKMNVDFEFDGEIHADSALDERIRNSNFAFSNLTGSANLLIMPDIDSANIAYNLLKTATNSVTVGPILLGASKPVHILTTSATARRIVNMTAVAVTQAQELAK